MDPMNTSTVHVLDLLPHPDQRRVYGDVGGLHDATFDAFCLRVEQNGRTLTPLVVSRGTPGLPDGTILSGHRRAAAAKRLGISEVRVDFVAYESTDHARRAFLTFNDQREKDQWVRTQEAVVWRETEAALARVRMSMGGKGGVVAEGKEPVPYLGQTRDAVAAKLGESGKTTELRFKLADAAKAQNPSDPSASPIAEALKADRPLKTVAREFGVIPMRPANTATTVTQAADTDEDEPEDLDAMDDDDEDEDDEDEDQLEPIDLVPVPVTPPAEPDLDAFGGMDIDATADVALFTVAVREFVEKVEAILAVTPPDRLVSQTLRARYENAFALLWNLVVKARPISFRSPEENRRGFNVIDGGVK